MAPTALAKTSVQAHGTRTILLGRWQRARSRRALSIAGALADRACPDEGSRKVPSSCRRISPFPSCRSPNLPASACMMLHDHARSHRLRSGCFMVLPDERHSHILARLTQDGRVLAADLARHFRTSEDTIRRDLRDLAAAGRCRASTAGRCRCRPPPARWRSVRGSHRIASVSSDAPPRASWQRGQVVLIDSGSTNLQVAEHLSRDIDLTVVTNAPAVAAGPWGTASLQGDHARG